MSPRDGWLRWLAAALILTGASAQAVHGGGNLQAGWLDPWGFNNSYWDERQQPVEWRLAPNPELGFTEEYLLPILQQALGEWGRFENVDAPVFVYDGLTTIPTGALNGEDSVNFGDLDTIMGISGAIASAPCSRLSLSQTVPSLGTGFGWLVTGQNPGAPRVWVPAGYYQQGVTLECDMIFNILEESFSDDFTPGTQDLLGVATHEFGHWHGLAHTPVPNATMYKIVTTNPPADGTQGQRDLAPDDISSLAHIYKTDGFDERFGTITGRVTLDGQPGDGVHVVAVDADTLEPVVGRLTMPWIFNDDDVADADDLALLGTGSYRLEGLPPGDYYVYAEWYDGTDERLGVRLNGAPNVPVVVSNVAIGSWPYWGELDFLPERFEFYNLLESADGGDGSTPGSTVDNPDEARLIHIEVGEVVSGIDIHINLDPDEQKPKLVRSDPTGIERHDLTPITSLRAGAVISTEGNGNDDYYVLHFPAAELPEPPYNVLEGIWTRWGRDDQPYTGGLMLGDPDRPEELEPAIVFDTRRLGGGWDDGRTGNPRVIDVRERFNVTINRTRDLYFVIRQPETPPEAMFFSEGWFVVVNQVPEGTSTGRTLVTRDAFETFSTSQSHDVVYRVRTEKAPPVMVNAVQPSTLVAGQRDVKLTLRGAGFREGAAVEFLAPRFGKAAPSGVEVREVQWIDSSTLELTVDVAPTAESGPLDVEVTNPEVVIGNRARLMSVEGDSSAPVIHAVSADPETLWPPNHRMIPVALTVDVEDDVDPAPACQIVSVESSDPDVGVRHPGDQATDWEITGALTVDLRATRLGRGRGRIYTIGVECADVAGNTASAGVEVRVPHDQGS